MSSQQDNDSNGSIKSKNNPKGGVAKFLNNFPERVSQLRESKFYRLEFIPKLNKCLADLEPRTICSIVCYGLGSFYSSMDVASNNQLVLLHLLHGHLEERNAEFSTIVKIYDPSFSTNDVKILRSFEKPSFDIMEIDECCAHKIDNSKQGDITLFYMPHLYKDHFENLIGANWSSEGLSNMFIYGNSFSAMFDSLVNDQDRFGKLSYIKKIVTNFDSNTQNVDRSRCKKTRKRKPKLIEVTQAIENDGPLVEIPVNPEVGGKDHPDGFNDMSFHYFRSDWLINNSSTIKIHKILELQVKSELR